MNNSTSCTSAQIQDAINVYNATNDFYLESTLSMCLSGIFLLLFVWQVYRVGKDIFKLKTGRKEFIKWKLIYISILISSFLGFLRCLIRGSLWDKTASGVVAANAVWAVLVNISYIFIFLSFSLVVSVWSSIVLTSLKIRTGLSDLALSRLEWGVCLSFSIPVVFTMILGTVWRFVESMISVSGGKTTSNLITLKIWCGVIMFWSIVMIIYCLIMEGILIVYIFKVGRKEVVSRAIASLASRVFGICFALLTKAIAFGVQIFLPIVISRWVVYLLVFGPEVISLYWMGEAIYSTGGKKSKAAS